MRVFKSTDEGLLQGLDLLLIVQRVHCYIPFKRSESFFCYYLGLNDIIEPENLSPTQQRMK